MPKDPEELNEASFPTCYPETLEFLKRFLSL